MKFKTEVLRELISEEELPELGMKIVRTRTIGHRRWSVDYYLTFSVMDSLLNVSYYGVRYSNAATEQQDERPFQYDGDEVECVELEPVEKVVIDYIPKKNSL